MQGRGVLVVAIEVAGTVVVVVAVVVVRGVAVVVVLDVVVGAAVLGARVLGALSCHLRTFGRRKNYNSLGRDFGRDAGPLHPLQPGLQRGHRPGQFVDVSPAKRRTRYATGSESFIWRCLAWGETLVCILTKKNGRKNGLATNRIFSLCQELNSHGQIRNEASFRQQRGRRLVFGTAAAKKKVFNPQVNCRIMRSRWRPQKTFVKKRRHSFAGNLLRCSFRC